MILNRRNRTPALSLCFDALASIFGKRNVIKNINPYHVLTGKVSQRSTTGKKREGKMELQSAEACTDVRFAK